MRAKNRPTILVTGDFSTDNNVYAAGRFSPNIIDSPATVSLAAKGGAWTVHKLLAAIQQLQKQNGDAQFEVDCAADEQANVVSAHALWEPQELEPGKKPVVNVWRLSRSLGFAEPHAGVKPAQKRTLKLTQRPDLLVIDEGGIGFRFKSPGSPWPSVIEKPGPLPKWIILKTVCPLFQGVLWQDLVGNSRTADRLVVLVDISDLRKHDARISCGLSWERTAIDLARELTTNPALSGLRKARHVIVSLGSEGCFWMQRTGSQSARFRLVFDPRHMEGEWAEAQKIIGEAFGYMSCLTAAVTAQLASPNPNLEHAIESALASMRELRRLGHGRVEGEPGIPSAALAKVMQQRPVVNQPFVSVQVPQDAWKGMRISWRMLEGLDSNSSRRIPEPLYGVAKRVAIFGPKALVEAPMAKFGKLLTVDRDEIEALRQIKQLISEYESDKNASKPLALAVFGPPGAGKSFGIKQIAAEVLGDKTPCLEFNLSQFSDPKDLIGAFHQVRDKVLEGKTPIVFWDEFDAKQYKWLQYFLAPVQDGRFQEGQLTHSTGKCVFVFAGATSYDMQNFGPPAGDIGAIKDFVLFKGPDYISRVHGCLNVLGPNPRQLCKESRNKGDSSSRQWVNDPSDICFPVRRALLLRALLNAGDTRLDIDRGLLAALLEVDRYTYGARSFERIVKHLGQDKSRLIRRSNLPADVVLKMNIVDVGKFMQIMTRPQEFQKLAEKLAPAIHDTYRRLSREQKWKFKYDMSYQQLPAEIKADNIAAAHRIPWILELAGLFLVPKRGRLKTSDPKVTDVLSRVLDVLAEEEHDLWMQFRLVNGWRRGVSRDDGAHIHDCLVPYRQLAEHDKKKDQNSVLNFPRIVELAGFRIVTRKTA